MRPARVIVKHLLFAIEDAIDQQAHYGDAKIVVLTADAVVRQAAADIAVSGDGRKEGLVGVAVIGDAAPFSIKEMPSNNT